MNDDTRPATPDHAHDPAGATAPRRKGIYVLPNAVTLAALFSGFYGIAMATSTMKGTLRRPPTTLKL